MTTDDLLKQGIAALLRTDSVWSVGVYHLIGAVETAVEAHVHHRTAPQSGRTSEPFDC